MSSSPVSTRSLTAGLLAAAVAVACLLASPTVEAAGTGASLNDSDCSSLGRIVERPSGQIIGVAGFGGCANDPVRPGVIQFTAKGVLDESFGEGGVAYLDNEEPVVGFFVRPDGASVIVQHDRITAFDAGGEPLSAFGDRGIVDTANAAPDGPNPVTAAAMQPDGQILISGAGDDSALSDVLTSRIDTSGSLDQSFGSGGTATAPATVFSEAEVGRRWLQGSIAAGGDGSIYLASALDLAAAELGTGHLVSVVRLDSMGQFDSAYGQNHSGFSSVETDPFENEWDPTLMKVTGGSVELAAFARGVSIKPFEYSYVLHFGPGGMTNYRRILPHTGTGFAANAEPLVSGTDHGPYADLDPYFNFSRWSLRPRTPEDEPVLFFKAYVGPGIPQSGTAIEAADGSGYFVSGLAEAERCGAGLTVRSCERTMVLAKIDDAGKFASGFGDQRGVTTVPPIHCANGASAEGVLDVPSRFRCRLPLDARLSAAASVRFARSRKPAVVARVKSIKEPVTEGIRYSFRVRLPEALKVKKGVLKRGIKHWTGGEFAGSLPNAEYDRRTRTFSFDLADYGPMDLKIRIRRGYLKRIPARRLGKKVRFRFELSQVVTQYVDRFTEEGGGEREKFGSARATDRLPPKKPRTRRHGGKESLASS